MVCPHWTSAPASENQPARPAKSCASLKQVPHASYCKVVPYLLEKLARLLNQIDCNGMGILGAERAMWRLIFRSICMSVCLSVCLCLSVSVCVSLCMSVYGQPANQSAGQPLKELLEQFPSQKETNQKTIFLTKNHTKKQ